MNLLTEKTTAAHATNIASLNMVAAFRGLSAIPRARDTFVGATALWVYAPAGRMGLPGRAWRHRDEIGV
jgi:hypothetical protein